MSKTYCGLVLTRDEVPLWCSSVSIRAVAPLLLILVPIIAAMATIDLKLAVLILLFILLLVPIAIWGVSSNKYVITDRRICVVRWFIYDCIFVDEVEDVQVIRRLAHKISGLGAVLVLAPRRAEVYYTVGTFWGTSTSGDVVAGVSGGVAMRGEGITIITQEPERIKALIEEVVHRYKERKRIEKLLENLERERELGRISEEKYWLLKRRYEDELKKLTDFSQLIHRSENF